MRHETATEKMQGPQLPEFTYTGQQFDDELGINLFYLRNRYYDPKIGRFTTPDPLVSDLNPYSYANNNPVMMQDPSGLSGTANWDPDAAARWKKNQPTEWSGTPLKGATDQYGRPLFGIGGDRGGLSQCFRHRSLSVHRKNPTFACILNPSRHLCAGCSEFSILHGLISPIGSLVTSSAA
jgi:RHS repeat-associated protein